MARGGEGELGGVRDPGLARRLGVSDRFVQNDFGVRRTGIPQVLRAVTAFDRVGRELLGEVDDAASMQHRQAGVDLLQVRTR